MFESVVSDAYYTVRDGYTCEAVAIVKSRVSDACYTVWNCVCVFRFILVISYQLSFFLIEQDPVFIGIILVVARNINACKAVAIFESLVSNTCYAVGDCYACEAGATAESIVSDACYTVADGYACEAVTKAKSRVSDACYPVGDGYACEAFSIA